MTTKELEVFEASIINQIHRTEDEIFELQRMLGVYNNRLNSIREEWRLGGLKEQMESAHE